MTQAQVVETNDMPIRAIGFTILFLVFGVFGSWAALAPLDSAALAPGVVTVKNYRKTVQHLEGGIVKEILVRDGVQVQAGDLLLVLDDTQARAEQEILRGQHMAAKALEARLIAERDGLETVAYPDLLLVDDARAREAMENENQQFNARKQQREGEIEVLEQRVGQLETQSRGLDALIRSKRQLVASYDEEIGDNKALLSQGYVDKQRLRDGERRKATLIGEIAEHQSSQAGIKVKIGETRLQILQLNKEFRSEVVNQLTETQTRVFDLQERIAAISDRVRRSEVTAPVAGMVLGMEIHTVGGVISPGRPILDIVPDNEELIVEAQVSPNDIDRVAPGLTADIRFSAFKSATTPVIEGRLLNLSADRLVNEETGMPYYLARVEVTEEGRQLLGDLKLVPGMPAEVLINTGARTLLEYLVQPATNAFARSMIED
ncbi:HlyD family type I secretion periplasmic adaptor subunit [Marinobacterium arenosum]|uniref:HlyD family type I secretion periplasmic adaptor subunit n=1 Tax=Marinobacterium arenosum TaxID=2862496 RepID=UPI001C941DAC|nr:HlyD family type I secretion periplasmic adaptor subunit [Marinobacterium arenosum]MBY4676793.1 HlyD family type I secretion periplasmic adaptor subunit [Marinobacterium arenosum]